MGVEISKALVVDDEESLREIIVEVLEILGIKSIEARDGEQAIGIAREHGQAIDVVFLDLFMPRMSGEETYHKLKEIIPDKPVVFMSGYDQQHPKTANIIGDGNKFLKKPFTINQIKEIILSLRG